MRNKILFYFFGIIIILNFGCSQKIVSDYRVKGNEQLLEKINVSALYKAKSKENNREKILVKKHVNPEKDLLHQIDYIITNKKTNRRTQIYWSLDSDYISKKTDQFGYPFKEIATYFKNGNLKSRYTKYIGNWKKDGNYSYSSVPFNHRVIIGKFYEYDIKGNVIKVTDYDKLYSFSVYDVIKLMKEQYLKSEFALIYCVCKF